MIKVGDEVEIVGLRDDAARRSCTGVEMFQQARSTRARPATTSGVLLRGIEARRTSSAARCWPSRARSRRTPKFEAEVYVLTKDEGGRHTPFFTGYRPQFYFRTTDVTGAIELPGGRRDVHAGRQRRAWRRADRADRHGRGPALRHPRGRPHRRRRAWSRRSSSREAAVPSGVPAQQKIRIRLKGYDHEQLDRSAKAIVETATSAPERPSPAPCRSPRSATSTA